MSWRQFRLIINPVWAQQRTVQSDHPIEVLLGRPRRAISDLELQDGRWIYDSTIALAEPAGSGCSRLLSDAEIVVQGRRLVHERS